MTKQITLKINDAKQTLETINITAGKKQAVEVSAKGKVNYQLIDDQTGFGPENIMIKRDGKDLKIAFEGSDIESPDLIIKDYYDENGQAADTSLLVGLHENGNIYPYVPESTLKADAVTELADQTSAGQALGGEPIGALWAFSPWWLLGLIPLALGGIALAHHSKDTPTTGAPTLELVENNGNPTGGVKVTPKANNDKVTINYTDENNNPQTIVINKNSDGTWSPEGTLPAGATLDPTTGTITLTPDAVKDNSKVVAIGEQDGAKANSSEITTPAYDDFDGDGNPDHDTDPSLVPAGKTLDNDDDNDGVNNSDEEAVGTDPKNPTSTTDAQGNPVNDGDLDSDGDGKSNAEESDDNGSAITDDNGNGKSDLLEKPAAPSVVLSDKNGNPTGGVEITPSAENDNVTITYTDENDQPQTIEVVKQPDGTWAPKEGTTLPEGATLDPETGKVTLTPDAVKDNSDVTAVGENAGATSDPATVTTPKYDDFDGDGNPDHDTDPSLVPAGKTLDNDDDNDGVNNSDEEAVGTDPKNPMTDGKTPDGDLDSDGDGKSNGEESDDNGSDITDGNGNGKSDLLEKPAAPSVVLSDKNGNPTGGVEITPSAENDKVTITYTDENDQPQTIEVVKQPDGTWAPKEGTTLPEGASLDPETGKVTLTPDAVKDNSDVTAVGENAGATSDPATVTTPKYDDTDGDGNPDHDTDPSLVPADKTLDNDDDNDGVNNSDEEAVGTDPKNPMTDGKTPDGDLDSDGDGKSNGDESDDNGSDITDGNSNGKSDLIEKPAAPTVELAGEKDPATNKVTKPTGGVEITPNAENDKVTITYTDENDQPQTIEVVKQPDDTWAPKEGTLPEGATLDPATGKVTLTPDAVKDNSDVTAVGENAGATSDPATVTTPKYDDTDGDGNPDHDTDPSLVPADKTLDNDDDNDGVNNSDEEAVGTDPKNPMTDGKTPDGDLDSDGDGKTNAEESDDNSSTPTDTAPKDGKADITTIGKPTIDIPEATDKVNAEEAKDGVQTNVTLPTGTKVGDKVVLTVTKPDGTTTTAETTVTQADLDAGKATVTIPKDALPTDGNYSAEAKITDASGTDRSEISEPAAFELDTTAPSSTTTEITNVKVAGDDNKLDPVEGNKSTSTVTGQVTGEFKADDVVTVTVNGKEYTGKVDSEGNFSIDVPTADLKADTDKVVDVKVTATDAAGNKGDVSTTKDYAVEQPTQPTITITDDQAKDVANKADGDITFTLRPSEPLTGLDQSDITPTNGTVKSFTKNDDGSYTVVVTPSENLDNGQEVKIAVAEGAATSTATGAGNKAVEGGQKVDNVAPDAPTGALDDTGSNTTDGVTKDNTVSVTGIEPNATWEYSTDGGNTWTKGTGTEFTLPEGTYPAGNIQVRQTDAAGNVSEVTKVNEGKEITVDTTKPTDTQVTDVKVAGDGTLDTTEQGNATTPVTGKVTGTYTAGDTVTVTVNGKETKGTVDADGNFTVNVPTQDLKDAGTKTVSVSVTPTDAAGNTGDPVNGSANYTVDPAPVTPPPQPQPTPAEVSSVAVDKTQVNEGETATFTVTMNNGNGASNVPFTLTGIQESDRGPLEFSNGVTQNEDGTLNIPNGVTEFTVKVPFTADETTEGNETATLTAGEQSANTTVIDSSTTPATPQPTPTGPEKPTIALTSDTGSSDSDKNTNNGELTIDAKDGEIKSVVVTKKDGSTETINLVDGKYTLPEGEYTKVVVTTTKDGVDNTAELTDVVIDKTAPTPVITELKVSADDQISTAEQAETNTAVTGTVTGAKAGDTVTVKVAGSDTKYTGTVGSDGSTFSVEVPTQALKDAGTKSVTASVSSTDTAGNTGTSADKTTSYTVESADPAPTLTDITPSITRIMSDSGVQGDFITNDNTPVVIGSLSRELASGETVKISLDEGKTWVDIGRVRTTTTMHNLDQSITFKEGSTPVWVKVVNEAGQESAIAKQNVIIDTQITDDEKPTLSTNDDNGVDITVPADAPSGTQITVTVPREDTTESEVTLTKNPDGSWTSSDPSVVPSIPVGGTTATIPDDKIRDGEPVKVTVTDAAGNTSNPDDVSSATPPSDTWSPRWSTDASGTPLERVEPRQIADPYQGEVKAPAGTQLRISDISSNSFEGGNDPTGANTNYQNYEKIDKDERGPIFVTTISNDGSTQGAEYVQRIARGDIQVNWDTKGRDDIISVEAGKTYLITDKYGNVTVIDGSNVGENRLSYDIPFPKQVRDSNHELIEAPGWAQLRGLLQEYSNRSVDTGETNSDVVDNASGSYTFTDANDSFTVLNNVNADSHIEMNAGNDSISVRGNTDAGTVIDMGSGHDLVVIDGLAESTTILTQAGDDIVEVGSINMTTIDTGLGNDTITINTAIGHNEGLSNNTLNLGDGHDSLLIGYEVNYSVISNVQGVELIEVHGDHNQVDLDSVNASEGNVLSIYGDDSTVITSSLSLTKGNAVTITDYNGESIAAHEYRADSKVVYIADNLEQNITII
ncbi:Ig-like domain-containing protein [Avibacterium sp. 21-586]|uniref:Ig-like domain-containing protein n=1 Tax=Avibacterium sp. 21-586 TaxID=2911534 RepID=UPI0022473871|nr:Ig-like domain-containing protein [Avibacterium sp. 21-586]MCW9709969.1 Ig-like domain-containing protein [Avibacterium sp. 21-586]